MSRYAIVVLTAVTLGGCVTKPNYSYDPTPNVVNDTAGRQVCSSSSGNAGNCAATIGSALLESQLSK